MEKEKERRRFLVRQGPRILKRTRTFEEAAYPTRRRLIRGTQSGKGKKVKKLTWKCSSCGKVNRPERRLLVILPVLVCDCGRQSTVEFDFSLHKIELNDQFLVPVIRKQKPKECSPSSMLSLAEISWRTNAIINGQELEDSEPHLSRADMLQKYNYLCDICEIDKRFNQTAVQSFLEVFSTIGVRSIAKEKVEPKLYMLPFYSAVRKEFSAICRLLGDGYPIRTSFYAGKNFSTLKPGKIYKSPGCGRVRHAIILIGAGRRGNINYYHLLNSWGRKFCLRILRKRIRVGKTRIWSLRRVRNTKKALGGFGLLRESDIVARPVTFLRHEDDRKYYESLLLEDIVPLGKTKEGPETASITPSWEAPQPSEGTSLMNSVLVSTESSGRGTQVAHAICSPGDEALVDCCNGYFASQISAPPPPNDMTVGQVADKLASFVAKNGRQFENITRQRNPGDTPFKFLFDKHSPDYKYYEFQLAEEEKALAQSKEAEASKSANSGIASFKAPAGKHRSSFEQKSNYQTPASALYGAYEGSSSHGSSSSYGDHMAPPSDPVALMEFYAKKAAQEEQKRTPRQSKDEMPPPPSLQGPPKKGHHMDDFILPEELENFMARCNDAAAQKATKEAAEKAKIQADNIGHKLLSKMGWREGSMLKEKNEQER